MAFKQDQAKKYKKADKLYQRSINEYAKVPKKKGIFQAQMLFETAYTFFMMRKYHFSLGQLLALQSPYYRINFFPELRILRSLIYYRNCKYEDTKQTISIFQKKYNPLKATLETLVKKRKAGKVVKWRREYFKYFLKQDKQLKAKKKTEVPTSILEVVRTAKELRNYRQLLKKLSEELAIIRSKGAAWKESNLGKALIEAAGKIRVNLQNRAGDSVYDSLNNVFLELRRLLTQATLIRIESLRKQKEELLRYAEGGGIEQDEYFYTIVTEQNHIYWPYQGEYWRDEVGYYRQFIQGECKR